MVDIEALAALAEAATPGPWDRRIAPREGESVDRKAEYLRGSLTDNGVPLSLLIADSPGGQYAYIIPAVTGDGPNAVANAEFIAAARTAVPELLRSITAALVLHAGYSNDGDYYFCVQCSAPYPCDTYRTLSCTP